MSGMERVRAGAPTARADAVFTVGIQYDVHGHHERGQVTPLAGATFDDPQVAAAFAADLRAADPGAGLVVVIASAPPSSGDDGLDVSVIARLADQAHDNGRSLATTTLDLGDLYRGELEQYVLETHAGIVRGDE